VGTGLTDQVMVGVVYGSNSRLVPAYPNEWEFYARTLPVAQARGGVVDVALQAGYNLASESVDGELLLGRSFGRLKLLAAGRAFSQAYDSSATRFAVTGGAAFHLTSILSVAGDYGVLLDRADQERAAWGVGLQIGVPYTPHSLSVHATNVGTASLEGASRGARTRWGFEYTIPITLRRYVTGAMPERTPERAPGGMAMGMDRTMGDTVYVDIRNLKYQQEDIMITPGTTVVWRNADPVQHTVIADDGTFDSGLIDPGESFAMTFAAEGVHAFHCMPHPFMTGRVVVRAMMDAAPDPSGKEIGR
jgi:plastocyanin